MKFILACLFCIGCCGVCQADITVRIGKDTDTFQAILTNPKAEEVVNVQALQSQQVLIQLASKGCEKKSLIQKLFGK